MLEVFNPYPLCPTYNPEDIITFQMKKILNKHNEKYVSPYIKYSKYDLICYFDASYRKKNKLGCCAFIVIEINSGVVYGQCTLKELPNNGSSYYESAALCQLIRYLKLNFPLNYKILIRGDCKSSLKEARQNISNKNMFFEEVNSKYNLADYLSKRYINWENYFKINLKNH